jgi:hypothetical protein
MTSCRDIARDCLDDTANLSRLRAPDTTATPTMTAADWSETLHGDGADILPSSCAETMLTARVDGARRAATTNSAEWEGT